MKRLLRISFNTLLNSFLPILMWIILGEIVDKDIVNIFTITYSFQFLVTLLVAAFGTGPNITSSKHHIKGIVDSNILVGVLILAILVSFFTIHVDSYIQFMNLDPSIYREFCVHSFTVMFFQGIVRILCEKLYFTEESKKANHITIAFNIINIGTIIINTLLFENNIAIALTIFVDFLLVWYLLITHLNHLDFHLHFFQNVQYVSNEIFDSIGMFIVYFIGQRITFEFGKVYLIAMNFSTLITDSQWDMCNSIITVATIDAADDKLKYNDNLSDGWKLTAGLLTSTLIMGLILYPFYRPDILVMTIFLGVQVIDLVLSPKIWIRQQYFQINYSARRNVFHKNVYSLIRILFAFIPNPYCTCIGQLCAVIYEVVIYNIYYKDDFYLQNGYLKMKEYED